MNGRPSPSLSFVIPAYNESAGLIAFHRSLIAVLEGLGESFEVIYCDDGSTDGTARLVMGLHRDDERVGLLRLTRNFGKEIATTAGIHHARGRAIITLDADGQHPVEMIPTFIEHWRAGARVAVGVRTSNRDEGWIKKYGSILFYRAMRLAKVQIVPGATDFRIIDQTVQYEFIRLTERRRITRGLFDWLGYEPEYVPFRANARGDGAPTYTPRKLFELAIDSMIALSVSPLYIAAYIGAVLLPVSIVLGLAMLGNAAADDPLHVHATGSAYVLVLVLFLVAVVLVSQGIIGLYLSHIHTETQNRPLYVVDRKHSYGFQKAADDLSNPNLQEAEWHESLTVT